MKIFKVIQKELSFFGIYSTEMKQKQLLNHRIMLYYLISGGGMISGAIFLICEAKTFQEYSINVYITSMLIVINFIFTSILFKRDKIFECLKNLEEILDSGKLKRLF